MGYTTWWIEVYRRERGREGRKEGGRGEVYRRGRNK